MSEQVYFIRGRCIAGGDPGLQAALAEIYGSPERPRCMCIPDGVDMYIARHGSFVVKRMPGTGGKHHPTCDAYETDSCQSGLGALLGEAVIERGPELVELRLAFPLTRRSGRAPLHGEPGPAAEVKVAKHQMSMRALLHFLWERAGFNRWSPAMEGKRNQQVLHKYLLEAASEIQTKGVRLADRLLVPEAYSDKRRQEQFDARRRLLAALYSADSANEFRMLLVVGEFKEVEDCSSGRKVWIKHLPEVPLFIQTKAWAKLEKQYDSLFSALDAGLEARPRLVLAALVYARQEYTFQIDTACCMLVSANWIPLEGTHELGLLDTLTHRRRRFLKPLRYDAAWSAQFANALLLDTGDVPAPLYVVSGFMDERERAAKMRLIASISDAWVWDTSGEMPALPAPVPKTVARARGSEPRASKNHDDYRAYHNASQAGATR